MASFAEKMLMRAMVAFIGCTMVVLECARIVLYPFWCFGPKASTSRLTVLFDGECVVCNGLRNFIMFRARDPAADNMSFLAAQKVMSAMDGTTELTEILGRKQIASSSLLDRLHVVERADTAVVHVGAYAVFRLLDECDAPFRQLAWFGRLLPQSTVDLCYETFSKQRHAFFGVMMSPVGFLCVDKRAQRRLLVKEASWLTGFVLAVFALVVLPLGDGHKDGEMQQVARLLCFALVILLVKGALLTYPESEDPAVCFYERYVGPASARSLAMQRMTASLILLVFTTNAFTAPLAESAWVPRTMCKPSGLTTVPKRFFTALGLEELAAFFDVCLVSSAALGDLETLTRGLLLFAGVGFMTRFTALTGALSFLVYGGVLRSYNSWRGHSFIGAFWTLLILALRGGSATTWSVDALLVSLWASKKQDLKEDEEEGEEDSNMPMLPGASRRRRPAQKNKPGANVSRADTTSRLADVDRGWTRFAVTMVFANNYLMAGLSKFCASGVYWAAGSNLKAKLLQVSLTQGSFGVYTSLGLRHFPTFVWAFLGVCGLFGEIVMGAIPFWDPAKIVFPAMMWSMHFGIIFLQHIVFIDLLIMIPMWYAWHWIDPVDPKQQYFNSAWNWSAIYARAMGGETPQAAPAVSTTVVEDEEADPGDREFTASYLASARKGARFSLALMGMFWAVWTRGAEFYPWNSFRMFADLTANPVTYERFVALGVDDARLRNWHVHEFNPVLNRKRMFDTLDVCARTPEEAICTDFANFAKQITFSDAPTTLVMQSRSWDYVKDIDNPLYCDFMTTYSLDVASSRVTKRENVECDEIDWKLCCTRTIGTI